jgi:hypothetical protein
LRRNRGISQRGVESLRRTLHDQDVIIGNAEMITMFLVQKK